MTSMDAIFAEPCSILYLLPYTGQSQLVNKKQKLDDLYFIQTVVGFTIVALETFVSGDLVAFDAQVGENLCQIRAYKTLLLAREYLDSDTKKSELLQKINQIKLHQTKISQTICVWENAIYNAKSYCKNLDGHESIEYFLKRHDLYFALDEDDVFLASCFFLTHFNIRDDNIPVAINLELIAKEFHVSKYRSKRLTHKYQLLVCKLGCYFITGISTELINKNHYTDILPFLYKISDENRAVFPCLITTEIIISHCNENNIPILFITHRKNNALTQDTIYFLFTHQDQKIILHTDNEQSLTPQCLVISGEMLINHTNEEPSAYVQHLLRLEALTVILANTASHGQYSGRKLANLRNNPFSQIPTKAISTNKKRHYNKLQTLREFSVKHGCSKENKSIFFLKHIYSSSFEKEIAHLQQTLQTPIYNAQKLIKHDIRSAND